MRLRLHPTYGANSETSKRVKTLLKGYYTVVGISAIDAISAFELPEMKDFDLFLSAAGFAKHTPAWINASQLQNIA